ncbi:MAG: SAM-dependent methyltransferase, partial [Crocosphaera sp.]
MFEIVTDAIQKTPKQCITFADYMELVLYHPQQGYYGSGKVNIGSQGDFFTSSSLGSDFGELLTEQLIEIVEIVGLSDPFTMVEVGGGTGQLAADLLNYLQQKYAEIYEKINYIIVEASPSLIEQQKHNLK